jgi:hypothetical protein
MTHERSVATGVRLGLAGASRFDASLLLVSGRNLMEGKKNVNASAAYGYASFA